VTAPSLADLRYAFWGAGAGESVSDAEYRELLSLYTNGVTMAGLAAASPVGSEVGAVSMNRELATVGTTVMTSQLLRLTYFTAPRSFTCTRIQLLTGGTAAGATPTLVRAGIYEVNPTTGNLTLVASIPNDTTIFAAANAEYTRNLSVPYSVLAGKRLALGMLVVTAAAAPSITGSPAPAAGIANVLGWKNPPAIAAQLAAQADLPAAPTHASLSATNGGLQYAHLLPAA
jgi:hypothetical protein